MDEQAVQKQAEEASIKRTQKIVVGIGLVLVLIGIVRQWPIYGKTYSQFIEGDGYLALMVGLVAVILGVSIRLFTVEYYEDSSLNSQDSPRKK